MAARGEFGVRLSARSESDDDSMDREQPFAAPGSRGGMSYKDLSDRISASVTQIGSNVASLQRLAKQASGAASSTRRRDQLSSIQKTTTELIRITNENMHRLESIPMKSMLASHQKRHLLHLERLRSSFKDTLTRYNAVIKDIVDREKKSVEEARRNVSLTRGGIGNDNADWEDVGDDEFLNASKRTATGKQQQQQQQREQEEFDLQAVRDREAALRALESDILDVNDIFRDISQMVHDQGSAIDHIESNIDTALIDVEGATDQIAVASRYQKKARSKKCVVIGLLLAVIAVIVLVVVLSNTHSN